jgi:hypothetical protein
MLLREVIARVLTDPKIQSLLTGAVTETSVKKPECLVIVENEEGAQALPDLEKHYASSGLALRLCVIDNSQVINTSLSRITWEEAKKMKTWERILVPVCSVGQLAQMALGISLDKISELTAWAIKQRIPVEIGQVEDEFTERTPQAYRDLFASYVHQLATYGVVIGVQPAVSQQVLPSTPLPGNAAGFGDSAIDPVPWSFSEAVEKEETAPKSRPEMSFTKRLFSVKESMSLPPYAILRIAKATVLTPSAIDALKSKNIGVFREGVQCL